MKKITIYMTGAMTTIAGVAMVSMAHAQSFFSVPTSTASSLTANVGDQIGDPGTLLVLGLAAGIPLAFYVIHQLIGLVPKSRARRQ